MPGWKWMVYDHGDGHFESIAVNTCGGLGTQIVMQVDYIFGLFALLLTAKFGGQLADLWNMAATGNTDQALSFLDDMGRKGPEPNETTYAITTKGLCRAGNTRSVIELPRDWEERRCRIKFFTYNIVIDSLCKEGFITEALRLHESQWKDASVLLEKMMKAAIKPNAVTYTSVIQGVCDSGQLKEAQRLLSHMVQSRTMPNVRTFTILVDAHCKEGIFEEAEAMQQIDKAMILLRKMEDSKFVPDIVTYNILIHGMCNAGKLDDAKGLFNCLHARGSQPDVWTYNIVMRGWFKGGHMGEAHQLLKEMEGNGCFPNGVTYNTIIQGLLRNNENTRAAQLVREMVERGFAANIKTMELWEKYIVTNGTSSFSI
ncbi:pentatricopeptide repeat-containing protein At3g22470, mitochondrial-like [Eucalyptus grandis]|uniref:pentatricopeptide repeat-containing protein At3g22470, mitochondrial-like n=1 Tax=Eucalyptus grandis TaxID=71139 RepID=UPI00192EFF46|nr:pentatricopeptide repeat-containing protein At3g22470, mitochondrial-like [Eucalyptus grandis]